jgi:hypothetical protein
MVSPPGIWGLWGALLAPEPPAIAELEKKQVRSSPARTIYDLKYPIVKIPPIPSPYKDYGRNSWETAMGKYMNIGQGIYQMTPRAVKEKVVNVFE